MAILPFSEKTITGVYGSMSEYRRKNNMQAHSGTDFAPAGSNRGKTAIPAVSKGTVKLVQWSNVLGWVIVQSAWDPKKKKAAFIGYCHLACDKHGINCKGGHEPELATKLKVDDELAEGDTVGIIGNTGSASSGAHLHLTISWGVKGVFGVTADKFDFVEWVKQQGTPAAKGAAKTETPAKKICPTCGQETK